MPQAYRDPYQQPQPAMAGYTPPKAPAAPAPANTYAGVPNDVHEAQAKLDFNSLLGSGVMSRDAKRARLLGILRGGYGGARKKSLENYLKQLGVTPAPIAPAWDKSGRRLSNDNADSLVNAALTISPDRWSQLLSGTGVDPLAGAGGNVEKPYAGVEMSVHNKQAALDFNSLLANPNMSLASKRARLNGILNGGYGGARKRSLMSFLSALGQPINSIDTNMLVNAALRVDPTSWNKVLSWLLPENQRAKY